MLTVNNLVSGYGKLQVLKNISMHIKPGEIVTIIGANGAGKTTLLNTISGIIRAGSGEILFNGSQVTATTSEKIVKMGCALVPEGRQIFNTLTVRENLLIGSYIVRDKAQIKQDMDYIYELFPVLQNRMSQLGGTLSGGEQQMLAIGRALMSRPKLIMLDEPSTGLAPLIVKNIFEIIKKLKSQGNTILLVEQNAKAALRIADRGYVIETGQIVLEDSSSGLLNNDEVQKAYLGKEYKNTKRKAGAAQPQKSGGNLA